MSNVFSPNQILAGRYEIIKYYAAGGMQEVYIARDLALDRTVALKTPKAGVVDRRFRRGAEMGARVVHPNVAATFDYYEDEKITFLVEEFVPGRDLAKLLDDEFYYLDPGLAAHILHHMARALNEAHRVGICHRDLKPSNIMTSGDPGVAALKLTDFGIAKLAESEIEAEMNLFDEDESTLTTSNTLLGAVPYMAPECWVNWKAAGQPMDIWAFGCIAYQLLVGSPPFGMGRAAIFNVGRLSFTGVNLEKPKWFSTHKVTEVLEEDLWKIIQGCLALNPDDRPNASQIVEAFNLICYASTDRKVGFVSDFKINYADGGTGNFGFINDGAGESTFFHNTVFFGDQPAARGQRVSFSRYPGVPNARCSPVLLLKPKAI
ncbi:serine/threonine protein kinase [Pseudomonas sp. GM78]|uniref:serine/threonine-protein kinase n=1 Tax=Pseudomonas sp. GM78 TaxID=1144337 RepID=UPI00026F6B7F|nr:serine/threonine-protein kinase [Pseudomonas sp. GM78]EJN32241.1 serine/threonine protein kinase [Pseudomonas sp. GM78]